MFSMQLVEHCDESQG